MFELINILIKLDLTIIRFTVFPVIEPHPRSVNFGSSKVRLFPKQFCPKVLKMMHLGYMYNLKSMAVKFISIGRKK